MLNLTNWIRRLTARSKSERVTVRQTGRLAIKTYPRKRKIISYFLKYEYINTEVDLKSDLHSNFWNENKAKKKLQNFKRKIANLAKIMIKLKQLKLGKIKLEKSAT